MNMRATFATVICLSSLGCGSKPALLPTEQKIQVIKEEATDQFAHIDSKLAAASSGTASEEIRVLFGRHFARAMEELLDEKDENIDPRIKNQIIQEASKITLMAQKPNCTVASLKSAYEQLKTKMSPYLKN